MLFPQNEIIFVLGMPYCGKQTQCQLLAAKRPHYVHISIRAILDQIQDFNADQLPPDDVVCSLLIKHMENHIKEFEKKRWRSDKSLSPLPSSSLLSLNLPTLTFLIDGFPSTLSQLKHFEKKLGRSCDRVLFIDETHAVCLDRLLQRRAFSSSPSTKEGEEIKLKSNESKSKSEEDVNVFNQRSLRFRHENGQILNYLRRTKKVEIVQVSSALSINQNPNAVETTMSVRAIKSISPMELSEKIVSALSVNPIIPISKTRFWLAYLYLGNFYRAVAWFENYYRGRDFHVSANTTPDRIVVVLLATAVLASVLVSFTLDFIKSPSSPFALFVDFIVLGILFSLWSYWSSSFKILQSSAYVKQVLLYERTNLGYHYDHFRASHPFSLNIMSMQTYVKNSTGPSDAKQNVSPSSKQHNNKQEQTNSLNCLWYSTHSALQAGIAEQSHTQRVVNKHIHVFLNQGGEFQLREVFETFMLRVWFEFMFGVMEDDDRYKRVVSLRQQILKTLRYTFYENPLRNIPVIGLISCGFRRRLKSKKFDEIRGQLQILIQKAINTQPQSFVARFANQLKNQDSHIVTSAVQQQLILDNTFIFFLVFDFIHSAMYETLVIASSDKTASRKINNLITPNNINNNNNNNAKNSLNLFNHLYQMGLSKAYLFQFRSRVALSGFCLRDHEQPVGLSRNAEIKQGETVYLNLLKSQWVHSTGVRACYGRNMAMWIREAVWKHLSDRQLMVTRVLDQSDHFSPATLYDLPSSPGIYFTQWQLSRTFLQSRLKCYAFRNIPCFFDILQIHQDPFLTDYIVNQFVGLIRSDIRFRHDSSTFCIVAPELRGVPVAAIVAHQLKLPIVVARKPGKIPGKTVSGVYSNAISTDQGLEMPVDCGITLDHKVIVIDDGLATGETVVTLAQQVKQLGAQVVLALTMINHTYIAKSESFRAFLSQSGAIHYSLFDLNPTEYSGNSDQTDTFLHSSPLFNTFSNESKTIPFGFI